MTEPYYSVEQIAAMLDMHPKTIQRYIREKRLKAQKIGKAWRVTGHDLSTFVEGTDGAAPHDAPTGLQAILGAAMENIKVSSVIDSSGKEPRRGCSSRKLDHGVAEFAILRVWLFIDDIAIH